MTNDYYADHLPLNACKALAELGYPQGTEREPSTLVRWVLPYRDSDLDPYLTAGMWIDDRTYACPDSVAALDWLAEKHGGGYPWTREDDGAAVVYWLSVEATDVRCAFHFGATPSALILAVAQAVRP